MSAVLPVQSGCQGKAKDILGKEEHRPRSCAHGQLEALGIPLSSETALSCDPQHRKAESAAAILLFLSIAIRATQRGQESKPAPKSMPLG